MGKEEEKEVFRRKFVEFWEKKIGRELNSDEKHGVDMTMSAISSAEAILNEYGKVIAELPEPGGLVAPISALPYTKDSIKEAILVLAQCSLNDEGEIEKEFGEKLDYAYSQLGRFVPDEEAEQARIAYIKMQSAKTADTNGDALREFMTFWNKANEKAGKYHDEFVEKLRTLSPNLPSSRLPSISPPDAMGGGIIGVPTCFHFSELPKIILNGIFIRPLNFLSHFFAPKKNLFEIQFTYVPLHCYIQTKPQSPPDELLIAALCFFLQKYFFICDARQIDCMKQLLATFPEKDPHIISSEVFESVFQTFTPKERNAIERLFTLPVHHLPFHSVFPFHYSEGEPDSKFDKIFINQYNFFVYQKRGRLRTFFKMSIGPDKVLLPNMVGLFYEYVMDKVTDENKNKLHGIIQALLDAYDTVDCRSLNSLALPSELLRTRGINISEMSQFS